MPAQHNISANDATARRRLLAALLRANAVPGRPRAAAAIARVMGPRTTAARVLAVAGTAGADVVVSGSTVRLTTAGRTKARRAPQPRELVRTRL